MAETVISNGITIDGEISGNEPVTVEGVVKGKISLESSLHVANGGVVEADVVSQNIEVSGQVTGNLTASERVHIASEGRMVGDVKSPRILIADGAAFKGHIDMDVD
ncbi:polymer-forming cytoskeletal protein [Microvenator marinus]|jgi:cytoskeletal protein CcmA (bactofilin family)|uniref:Polymer-forming cytoskeletal protein n=1 Tax=Microvenator marinus TaxID=2600177 RepID=A0A5B8XLK2_9DELT|nr:polymer-forming cytoskeletal protein [Microvenator marinus]QED26524.1 polymer-forming cytoskeletal protein [Microvenator marinus]